MLALIGQKKEQSQRFLENGKRVPVTLIDVKGNTIVALKTQEKDKYQAVQLGFSMKKKASKAEVGHAKGAKLDKAPKFLKEVKISNDMDNLLQVGSILNPMEVFEPGDMVDVSGFSKGKGFQGGVKRWGFHGGPKTHGQSDRHRAPGSIGQGTTPGRVYKGKKMAGNMGNENVTIKNLEVIEVTSDGVLTIKGLVPGIINAPLMIIKTGKDKNFVPLYKSPETFSASVEAEAKSDNKATEGQGKIVVESAKQTTDESVDEDKEKLAEIKDAKVSDESKDENRKELKAAAEEDKSEKAKADENQEEKKESSESAKEEKVEAKNELTESKNEENETEQKEKNEDDLIDGKESSEARSGSAREVKEDAK